MSDDLGAQVRAVALKVLTDRVKQALDETKKELVPGMEPGDRKIARLPNGVKVGGITYTEGRTDARIVDELAFLHWCSANRPDEVVMTVRGSYRAAVLDAAKKSGDATDPKTGEVIPGIEVGKSDGWLTVTVDKDNLPALTEAIRANGLLALEAGDSE